MEEVKIDDMQDTNDSHSIENKKNSYFLILQGKEGEIACLRYNSEGKSCDIIQKWKEAKIVGFTKITVNNKMWRANQNEKSNLSMMCDEQIFRSLDQIRFYYPDNDNQTLESYILSTETHKNEGLFIPLSKGNKELSMCCLKHVAFERDGKIVEFVIIAQENSSIGIVSLSPTKFSSSKYKEVYQIEKKAYSYCIQPYRLSQQDNNLIMNLLIGLNLEEALNLAINLENLQVVAANLMSLSSPLKPGINNIIVFRDGKYILISTSDFKLKICRTKDFKPIVSLALHENYINDILITAASEEKEYLVSCSENYDFCVLDLSSLKKTV